MRIRLSSLVAIIALSCLCLAAEPTTYVVKKGDTLYGIARSFGVGVSALAAANGLEEGKTLLEGKKLVIPVPGSGPSPSSAPARTPSPTAAAKPSPSPARKPTEAYTIRQGDTLFGIARAHNMDIDELLKLNGLSRNSVIKAGKKLNVYAAPQASALPRSSPAGASPPAAKKVATGVSWPVNGKMEYMDGLLHGISITARKGDPIRAVANGTVVQASSYRGYSGVVFVERADKMIYVYGGNDSLLVKKGDKIQAGAKLGYLGLDPKTGLPTMSFLVFQNGKALDPSTCPRD